MPCVQMVTDAAIYPWQQALWQHLLDYVQQQRIPQALLITGANGLGKRHLAEVFAQRLMCHAPLADHSACGQCQSCKLLAGKTHTDFVQVEPDEPGKAIGIDKIRQLIVTLALKPQYETFRVVIITPADQLNTASANAFLKCLEEPTERTCLILLTDKPSRLPATIRSRCQTIHCRPPDRAIAKQWLQKEGVIGDIDLVLNLAQGAPLVAKDFANRNLLAVRQAYFESWLQIADGEANLVQLAEQWQKAENLDLAILLRWMLNWVVDIIKAAHRAEVAQLHNPDMKKSLQALADKLELKGLYRFHDDILKAHSRLNTPINKQLMLEQLLINWSQLNTR